MWGAFATKPPSVSLFDVDRLSGSLQRRAHGFGDAHESAVEQFKRDRVGLFGGEVERLPGGRRDLAEAYQPFGVGGGAPARGECNLCIAPHDQGRTFESGQCVCLHHRSMSGGAR